MQVQNICLAVGSARVAITLFKRFGLSWWFTLNSDFFAA
jgi:hypothetical protein